jgi:hypothetical protein
VVATTRPETMLGDTAVAVNPKDPRYADLRGATVRLPLMDRDIPVIFDELADPQFGTGVVKVTPAHDPNDFEAGRRHDLPKIQVIDHTGRMTAAAGPYASLDRFEARKRAGPGVFVRRLDQTGPHRVQFDLSRHPPGRPRLDRARVESILPHMPDPMRHRVPELGEAPMRIAKRSRQRSLVVRHGHNVQIVGHQAIRLNPNAVAFRMLGQ